MVECWYLRAFKVWIGLSPQEKLQYVKPIGAFGSNAQGAEALWCKIHYFDAIRK